ncbi:MAG: GtrA family protein [Acetobacteraceae bacterium]
MMSVSFLPAWFNLEGEKAAAAVQMIQFGLVGSIGFVFDTATVYTLRQPLGLYNAGLVGYVVAASVNWLLNRLWTFHGSEHTSMPRQWARFMIANLVGLVLNRGTYSLLVTVFPLAARMPVLAVAGGAVAGFGANFLFSRRFVFR